MISLGLVNTKNTSPKEMFYGFEYQLHLSVPNSGGSLVFSSIAEPTLSRFVGLLGAVQVTM